MVCLRLSRLTLSHWCVFAVPLQAYAGNHSAPLLEMSSHATEPHLIVSPETRFLHVISLLSWTLCWFLKSNNSSCVFQFEDSAIQRQSQYQLLSSSPLKEQSIDTGLLQHRITFGFNSSTKNNLSLEDSSQLGSDHVLLGEQVLTF